MEGTIDDRLGPPWHVRVLGGAIAVLGVAVLPANLAWEPPVTTLAFNLAWCAVGVALAAGWRWSWYAGMTLGIVLALLGAVLGAWSTTIERATDEDVVGLRMLLAACVVLLLAVSLLGSLLTPQARAWRRGTRR